MGSRDSPTSSVRSACTGRAFARSSGTDVVVDLVVLRRRPPEPNPPAPAGSTSHRHRWYGGWGGDLLEVNEYFVANPDRVLGELAATRGMYRDHELTVVATGDLNVQLPAALAALTRGAHAAGSPRACGSCRRRGADTAAPSQRRLLPRTRPGRQLRRQPARRHRSARWWHSVRVPATGARRTSANSCSSSVCGARLAACWQCRSTAAATGDST